MIESRRQFCTSRILLVMIGTTLLLAFGAWQLGPLSGVAFVGAAQPNDSAPHSARITGGRGSARAGTQDRHVGAEIAPLVLTSAESPNLENLRKKEPPTGKEHDRPNDLLRYMARQLHNDAVDHFINTRGMGFARLGPTVRLVQREWNTTSWSRDELEKESPLSKARDFDLIHRGS